MKISLRKLRVLAFIAFFLVNCLPVQAQEQATKTTVVVPITVDKGPEDALDRGNPRSSIVGYLTTASEFNWEKAAEYLDLRNLPPDIQEVGGPELARQFNHVVSRSVWLDRLSISDSPQGLQGDDLPAYRDELMRIPGEDGEIPIWMQQVPRVDGVMIWKLSNRSVARIPELYDLYSYPALIEKVRGWFPDDVSFLGLEAFKWFIIIVVALVCWRTFSISAG